MSHVCVRALFLLGHHLDRKSEGLKKSGYPTICPRELYSEINEKLYPTATEQFSSAIKLCATCPPRCPKYCIVTKICTECHILHLNIIILYYLFSVCKLFAYTVANLGQML